MLATAFLALAAAFHTTQYLEAQVGSTSAFTVSFNQTTGQVTVYGTNGNDAVTVGTSGPGDSYASAKLFVSYGPLGGKASGKEFPLAQVTKVKIVTVEGLDRISLDGKDAFTRQKAGNPITFASEVWAGADDDMVYGGEGNDTVNLGMGNDWVSANKGRDTLSGTGGNDRLLGDAGADTLDGGNGSDTCAGTSEDTFISCETKLN